MLYEIYTETLEVIHDELRGMFGDIAAVDEVITGVRERMETQYPELKKDNYDDQGN